MKLRLKRITKQVAPALTAFKGVGLDVASTLVLTAGCSTRQSPLATSRSNPVSRCGATPTAS